MMGHEERYEMVHEARANQGMVFDLLDELRLAYERIMRDHPLTDEFRTVEVMMAVHNFHKLIVQHLAREMPATTRSVFFGACRATWDKAMRELEAAARKDGGAESAEPGDVGRPA